MAGGIPIEITGLTKHFGAVTAVDDLSFTVQPGCVTGFLGPNGAGKTTTLRMLLGLVTPSAGTATFDGTPYAALENPLSTVGAALEPDYHPGRSAHDHLAVYATAAGIGKSRVGEVLEQVGMAQYAKRRVGGFSLGMRQRLSLAYTLLGDPSVLVLDEPINGLDPEGIKWIRAFLRTLAEEGRTVLVSSHLLSEVQQSVDEVVIISRGRVVRTGTLASLELDSAPRTIVDSPARDALGAALTAASIEHTVGRSGFIADEPDPARIGHVAFAAGVEVSVLHRLKSGLEDSFLSLVNGGGADAATEPEHPTAAAPEPAASAERSEQ